MTATRVTPTTSTSDHRRLIGVDRLSERARGGGAALLNQEIESRGFVLGDIVAMEVLRGLRQPARVAEVRGSLLASPYAPHRVHPHPPQGSGELSGAAVADITVRGSIDCVVATFCIEGGHTLLHADHDFDAFEQHLGLRVLR